MSTHVDLTYIRGVSLVAVAAVLWSTGGALIKATELDFYQVSFWRSFFAFITLILLIRPRRIALEWSSLIASSAYALTMLFFVIGTKFTTAANAVFLQYTAPLYVVLLSYLLFREKFSYREVLTLLFCVIGIVLFFSDRVDLTGYIGMAWSITSGVTYAIFIIFSKKRSRGHYAEPVMLGALLCALLSGFLIVSQSEGGMSTGFVLEIGDALLLAFLGIFQIGVPCFIYMKGLRAVSPLEAGIITMLEPICNPIWAYLLITEVPSINTMAGGGIILLAILAHTWETYSRNRRNRKKEGFSKF